MAKKSRKKSALPKKDNAGCMSGLISMFDFRQGRFTRKLLSNKKCESCSSRPGGTLHSRIEADLFNNLEEQHEDVNDSSTNDVTRVNSVGVSSIKALMSEEMSGACTSNQISSSRIEHLRSELGFEANLEKNQTKNKFNSIASRSTWSSSSEINCFDANLAELMDKFFSENDKCQEKHNILQNALGDITKACLTEKSIDSKDILEMLKSNKEVTLKLLQDPDSLIFKHILDLQKIQISSRVLHGNKLEEEPAKQNRYNFFKKKDKLKEGTSDKKRIVVLKPNPLKNQEFLETCSTISSPKSCPTERATSQLSLKEIKRKLRNVLGESRKDRKMITMDGILHKVPYGCQSSDEGHKICKRTGQSWKLSSFLNKKMNKPIEAHLSYTESVIYDEARKRLAEMLSSRSQNEILSPKEASKHLGRILSIPEYNSLSPKLIPVRDKEIGSSRSMKLSPSQEIEQEDSATIKNAVSDSNSENEVQVMNTNPTIYETHLHIEEDSTLKGSTETELLEPSINEPGCGSDRCSQKEPPAISGSFEEAQQATPTVSFSPNPLLVQRFESSEIIADSYDCPLPVSILEPFLSRDINSRERSEANQDLRGEPQQFLSEAPSDSSQRKLNYVRTVLKASGLNYYQFPEKWRWLSSNQLLDPLVYDEVENLNDQPIPDSKLLFDCINEVLNEIPNRYIIFTPWISSIRPSIRPIPKGEKFVQEVCKEIDWHFQVQMSQKTDEIVRKDVDSGSWMNVRLESEGAVFDIGEEILGYIMEETILELWE